jgi:hypothetical protein
MAANSRRTPGRGAQARGARGVDDVHIRMLGRDAPLDLLHARWRRAPGRARAESAAMPRSI